MRLLLISNSARQAKNYLERSAEHIGSFLSKVEGDIVFIPFAGVTFSFDQYVERVNNALQHVGVKVRGVHTYKAPIKAVSEVGAIMVGGGNTFQLLKMM